MAPDAVVGGLLVGHAQDPASQTGCTVLLGPFRCVADVRGMATGTRELHALSPLHLAPLADAILLAGGSAYGLAAADGVMAWLEERGRGFATPAARVPIVPAAVIYDLAPTTRVRPDAALGRAACDAASATPASGRVGAGTGATVGKLLGPAGAMAGGCGIVTERSPHGAVTAVAVVNALGDVRDADGRIIAGARDAGGRLVDSAAHLRAVPSAAPPLLANTTLVAVVTDAPLGRTELEALARLANTAVARRITPVHTPFDGDVLFAASTAPEAAPADPAALLALGEVAAHAVGQAIERAVRTDA
jgi:L-aminopeptidase/D-esterase-like protein